MFHLYIRTVRNRLSVIDKVHIPYISSTYLCYFNTPTNWTTQFTKCEMEYRFLDVRTCSYTIFKDFDNDNCFEIVVAIVLLGLVVMRCWCVCCCCRHHHRHHRQRHPHCCCCYGYDCFDDYDDNLPLLTENRCLQFHFGRYTWWARIQMHISNFMSVYTYMFTYAHIAIPLRHSRQNKLY